MTEYFEGGCLCGAIRYRFEGPPRVVSHCHCGMCRSVSGAGFLTWLTVRKDRTAIDGELGWYTSSDWGRRGFCQTCGTHVAAGSDHYPRHWDIPAGTLDAPGAVTPERHVFADDKVDWIDISDDLPVHGGDATTPAR